MPRPIFRPKSGLEKTFESEGLTGESTKDLNLYPKLQQHVLPYPTDNPAMTMKIKELNDFAIRLDSKFKESPGKLFNTYNHSDC